VTLTKKEFEKNFRIGPLRGHERFMATIKITKFHAREPFFEVSSNLDKGSIPLAKFCGLDNSRQVLEI
jgi:predicted RNA-binding protein